VEKGSEYADTEDIAAFEERVGEPLISYDEIVKRLRKMAAYRVFFNESTKKNIHGLPKKDLRKIHHRIKMLSDDPRPSGHEKLTGQERYRIRQCRDIR
jgi:hypothetical protein